MTPDAPRLITERHRVIAGVIWLDHAPVASVETVRCAADPEGVWILLRPGRDYRIVDADGGQLSASALVGTLVEVVYTREDEHATVDSRAAAGRDEPRGADVCHGHPGAIGGSCR